MYPSVVTVALFVLALIGTALVIGVLGIYNRLSLLIAALHELRDLAVNSQGELVQTKEGIGKVHVDLGRLVTNSNVTSELVRSVTRLPNR
jgi:hypothetical protein